jgi:acyl-CoA synthetase (AMP-forming)/AMP-acid ligase II
VSVVNGASSVPLGLGHLVVEAARARPDAVALRYKHRGVWLVWNWRDVVREVDRFASFLRERAIGGGTAIAIVGEIRPSALFAAIAGYAIGAKVLLIAPDADRQEVAAALAKNSLYVVLVQGRQALATWLQALGQNNRSTQIVFDHATPGDVAPDKAVLPLSEVTKVSRLHGWADTLDLVRGQPESGGEAVWIEASTSWSEAADVIIRAWLSSRHVLAIPELTAAAARDRVEIRPHRWIASSDCATVAAAEIAGRLPRTTGWLNSAARKMPALRHLLVNLIRYRLGLSRLTVIEVEAAWQASAAARAAEATFASLGIPLQASMLQLSGQDSLRPEPPRRPHLAVAGNAG